MAENQSLLRAAGRSGIPFLIVRLALGAYFIYMGVSKVQEPFTFLKLIRQYEMLPETPAVFLNSVAVILPWLEIFSGLALMIGFMCSGAAATIGIMFAVFTPAILLRALEIQANGTPFFEVVFDCGCGGGPVVIWKKLLTNTALLVVSIVIMLSRSRRFCLDLLLDRYRSKAVYCGTCGYSLSDASTGACSSCGAAASYPSGTAEVAG